MKMIFYRFVNTVLILIAWSGTAWGMAQRPAADPSAPQPPAWVSFMPIIVMIAVFYFLLIRPQMKQRKEKQDMIGALKKGDKVVTQGGLIVTIVNMEPHVFEVKINDETRATIQRSAVVDIVK